MRKIILTLVICISTLSNGEELSKQNISEKRLNKSIENKKDRQLYKTYYNKYHQNIPIIWLVSKLYNESYTDEIIVKAEKKEEIENTKEIINRIKPNEVTAEFDLRKFKIQKVIINNSEYYDFYAYLGTARDETHVILKNVNNILTASFWYSGYSDGNSEIIVIKNSIYAITNNYEREKYRIIYLDESKQTEKFIATIIKKGKKLEINEEN